MCLPMVSKLPCPGGVTIHWLQVIPLVVKIWVYTVIDGIKWLFAKRTFRFVPGPLTNTAETKHVQTVVQAGQIVKYVQTDRALGIGRYFGRHCFAGFSSCHWSALVQKIRERISCCGNLKKQKQALNNWLKSSSEMLQFSLQTAL